MSNEPETVHQLSLAIKALSVLASRAYWATHSHCGGDLHPECHPCGHFETCRAEAELKVALDTLEAWGCREKEEFRELREQLASLEHEQWVEWSKEIATSVCVSLTRIERWQKLWKPYSELTEADKDQDRVWADKVLSDPAVLVKADNQELPEHVNYKDYSEVAIWDKATSTMVKQGWVKTAKE